MYPKNSMISMAGVSECHVCPENSMSSMAGMSECPCVKGYYRTPKEEDPFCTCLYIAS